MSRLYTVACSATDGAAHFEAELAEGVAVPSETTEGKPGLIVHEDGGRRVIKSLHWGFPRLTKEMRSRGEKPGRIGLVADLTKSDVGASGRGALLPSKLMT